MIFRIGEVAEWSIAAVLKTVVLRGTRGSNPCLSAWKFRKCLIYGTFLSLCSRFENELAFYFKHADVLYKTNGCFS